MTVVRIAILGNSGSGKSTLAKWLGGRTGAAVLDLDTAAWEPGAVGVPRPVDAAVDQVRTFCAARRSWIVEGCYANLIRATFEHQPRLLFLNPGEQQCLDNCRARPWERHKYPSMAEQDQRLPFLLSWVSQYYTREGEMSQAAHVALFRDYAGAREELTRLPCLESPSQEVMSWIAGL